MNVSEFGTYWQKNYPDCPPVSYLLKWRLSDRWFRIHSLPASKRYAESDAERQELLDRQNTVLLDVIGEGAEFVAVAGEYSESAGELPGESRCPTLSKYITHSLPSLSIQEF